jgi:CRP/FNR family transcriptional regulator
VPHEYEALQHSFLGALPRATLDRLLADAVRLDIPAGAVAYRDSEAPRAAVVLSGVLRVYLTSTDGRQTTVRYARQSDVLGIPVAVGGPVPVSV